MDRIVADPDGCVRTAGRAIDAGVGQIYERLATASPSGQSKPVTSCFQ
jgi:hypothetical protein